MAASDLSPDARGQTGSVMSAPSLSGTPRALEERQRPGLTTQRLGASGAAWEDGGRKGG